MAGITHRTVSMDFEGQSVNGFQDKTHSSMFEASFGFFVSLDEADSNDGLFAEVA